VIASGKTNVAIVKHYGREWITPDITIPSNLSAGKLNAKLVLDLIANDKVVSTNEYKILLAKKQWSSLESAASKKIVLVDFNNNTKPVFDLLNIKTTVATSISAAVNMQADLYVFTGLDTAKNCSAEDARQIRSLVAKGGKLLLLSSPSASKAIYPEYITGWLTDLEADIANPEIPESPVFNDIGPLELRYFNNNKRELPAVCNMSLTINRNNNIDLLASHIRIHGYINGDMEQRSEFMKTIKGFPIVKIKDNGDAIISTMMVEKGITDPVAGKLLSNMVADLLGLSVK
jgi:hypothetical protein